MDDRRVREEQQQQQLCADDTATEDDADADAELCVTDAEFLEAGGGGQQQPIVDEDTEKAVLMKCVAANNLERCSEVEPVNDEGNCLYDSFAIALQYAVGGDFNEVKRNAIKCLREHETYFAQFAQGKTEKEQLHNHRLHLHLLKKRNAHGDNFSLVALGRHYQVDITVIDGTGTGDGNAGVFRLTLSQLVSGHIYLGRYRTSAEKWHYIPLHKQGQEKIDKVSPMAPKSRDRVTVARPTRRQENEYPPLTSAEQKDKIEKIVHTLRALGPKLPGSPNKEEQEERLASLPTVVKTTDSVVKVIFYGGRGCGKSHWANKVIGATVCPSCPAGRGVTELPTVICHSDEKAKPVATLVFELCSKPGVVVTKPVDSTEPIQQQIDDATAEFNKERDKLAADDQQHPDSVLYGFIRVEGRFPNLRGRFTLIDLPGVADIKDNGVNLNHFVQGARVIVFFPVDGRLCPTDSSLKDFPVTVAQFDSPHLVAMCNSSAGSLPEVLKKDYGSLSKGAAGGVACVNETVSCFYLKHFGKAIEVRFQERSKFVTKRHIILGFDNPVTMASHEKPYDPLVEFGEIINAAQEDDLQAQLAARWRNIQLVVLRLKEIVRTGDDYQLPKYIKSLTTKTALNRQRQKANAIIHTISTKLLASVSVSRSLDDIKSESSYDHNLKYKVRFFAEQDSFEEIDTFMHAVSDHVTDQLNSLIDRHFTERKIPNNVEAKLSDYLRELKCRIGKQIETQLPMKLTEQQQASITCAAEHAFHVLHGCRSRNVTQTLLDSGFCKLRTALQEIAKGITKNLREFLATFNLRNEFIAQTSQIKPDATAVFNQLSEIMEEANARSGERHNRRDFPDPKISSEKQRQPKHRQHLSAKEILARMECTTAAVASDETVPTDRANSNPEPSAPRRFMATLDEQEEVVVFKSDKKTVTEFRDAVQETSRLASLCTATFLQSHEAELKLALYPVFITTKLRAKKPNNDPLDPPTLPLFLQETPTKSVITVVCEEREYLWVRRHCNGLLAENSRTPPQVFYLTYSGDLGVGRVRTLTMLLMRCMCNDGEGIPLTPAWVVDDDIYKFCKTSPEFSSFCELEKPGDPTVPLVFSQIVLGSEGNKDCNVQKLKQALKDLAAVSKNSVVKFASQNDADVESSWWDRLTNDEKDTLTVVNQLPAAGIELMGLPKEQVELLRSALFGEDHCEKAALISPSSSSHQRYLRDLAVQAAHRVTHRYSSVVEKVCLYNLPVLMRKHLYPVAKSEFFEDPWPPEHVHNAIKKAGVKAACPDFDTDKLCRSLATSGYKFVDRFFTQQLAHFQLKTFAVLYYVFEPAIGHPSLMNCRAFPVKIDSDGAGSSSTKRVHAEQENVSPPVTEPPRKKPAPEQVKKEKEEEEKSVKVKEENEARGKEGKKEYKKHTEEKSPVKIKMEGTPDKIKEGGRKENDEKKKKNKKKKKAQGGSEVRKRRHHHHGKGDSSRGHKDPSPHKKHKH
eukprot:TRINITY_DN50_c0_g2_i1.p1 TRINITY_DN50_c0_g2~~TRINITY_DN50_c0_g2_i1.p1  ORF type:complete len:1476 (+),score=370.38 TRINITY_DN50_c0_g2_i1:144-4571(+)